MPRSPIKDYTIEEEIWSSIAHGLGIILSTAGLVILVILSAFYGNWLTITSTSIFGASAIMLYTSSTLYHAIPNKQIKKVFKKLDHISIYYLIAGTYTPFLLLNIKGTTGWIIFFIIWSLAVIGTFLKIFTPANGTKVWSIGLYLIMGWMIIFASRQLAGSISASGLTFLILGGLFYTLGIFFYIWKSKKYTHAIWHFFVLAGTIMHFFAILYSSVLPSN